MSDRRTDPAPGRMRIGLLAVIVVVALLAGIALMIYAVRNSGGWFVSPAAAPAAQADPRAAAYVPAQPEPAAAPLPSASPAAGVTADDPATVATRETALAAQLASLEARTAAISVDAGAAAGQAARAEAILVAFAVRRAIERGVPLGYLEPELRARFGTVQPRPVAIIIQASRTPLTVATLRQGLDANAGDLMSGGASGGDILSSLVRELRMLVVIHDAGTPSPLPAERLERARRLIDAGQVAAALAEVKRLPGADAAGAWIAAAQRYVETRQALDAIESAAILGQAAGMSAAPGIAVAPAAGAPSETPPAAPALTPPS